MAQIRVQERGQRGGKRNSHDLYIVMLLDGHLPPSSVFLHRCERKYISLNKNSVYFPITAFGIQKCLLPSCSGGFPLELSLNSKITHICFKLPLRLPYFAL